MASVFVTGATGYVGRHLIPALLARGHRVRGLVRTESAAKLVAGEPVIGDVLHKEDYVLSPEDTVVHLAGTPRPNPRKGVQFRAFDLPSIQAAAAAAHAAGVKHFVYVSVAHPAPVMRDYIAVRQAGEAELARLGLCRTIIRPWYVLGPGHWWPYALKPFYWLAARSRWHRAAAARLGVVTIQQMVGALVEAVEQPPAALRIVEPPEIANSRS
ncbi:MAG: NAD(P)H-binding protein [Bryobacteraceae bacterium]|nr:NAD(P)H-binding protein [Bryobacteraceae bacterium]